ncbi:putative tRNA (cytosine(34)-C(5))-methyltransferase [Besnoitia besnoiti]|uniref:Putative tRNA (Cytosine(34)-C(5))-methyltransferase n=1 Tax=Besnoitia besnoiti TaxID=94643 RepID=A0A2A9MCR9_BESBE|nr:putative tRNA (cytosine(34)-C(5))-methyltransferase [Besnoitia besnoiti]PFH33172.1 putative tRNA (cytosine(34)-C(5))-methyltransferase [Besnoitia besnoiti]
MGKKKANKGAEKEGNGVWLTSPDVRENAEWEAYYQQQKVVPEDEWATFLECLKTDLPTAFRVVTCTPHQHYIRAYIQQTMKQLEQEDTSVSTASEAVSASSAGASAVYPSKALPPASCWRRDERLSRVFRAVSWFLQGSEAYQIDVSRAALRSSKSLLTFHQFLVAQSEAATIMRQEVVSMIPALFFDIKADSRVLDLCAAPGSKTSQLLERMHVAHEKERARRELAGQQSDINAFVPPGLVVANDADSGRAHMLIHHLRHIHSPCLLATSHSAQFFPTILVPSSSAESVSPVEARATASPPALLPGLDARDGSLSPSPFPHAELRPLLFDCVLCDVPCSADGTLRKARSLWTRWHSNQGLGCHRLQLQILLRGIKLCKVGGRIVYSTCSFNPVENEAVVAAALEKTKGAVELVDCTEVLPSLQRRPGLNTWRVYWQKEFYDKFEDVPDTSAARQKIRATIFPRFRAAAAAGGEGEQPTQEAPPLHRCMRFLPHLNNTGGFFVAVLEKKRHVPFHVTPRALGAEQREQREDACADADEEEEAEEAEPSAQPAQADASATAGEVSRKPGNAGEKDEPVRSLDQLQLDFVSMGWEQRFVEKQQMQFKRKVQQALAADAAKEASGQAQPDGETVAPVVAARQCRPEVASEGSEVCIREEKLRAAWEAACAALGVRGELVREAESPMRSEGASEGGGSAGDCERPSLRLLQELRACLFVRRRGEGENVYLSRKALKQAAKTHAAAKTEASAAMEESGTADAAAAAVAADGAAKDDKLLRTVWLVSRGVERALSGVGRSRYKVVSAGCVAHQCRNASKYRLSYGGAQWLVPLADAVDGEEAERRRANSKCARSGESRVILRISNELMMALLGSEGAPPRVDMSTLTHLEGGRELRETTEEGPLVLVTTPERSKQSEEPLKTTAGSVDNEVVNGDDRQHADTLASSCTRLVVSHTGQSPVEEACTLHPGALSLTIYILWKGEPGCARGE